uniref:Glutamate rich 6 n=1 Tax=Nothoprocta perdicaria TaxID=30464 RepID=A0A8C7E889_NOTPE
SMQTEASWLREQLCRRAGRTSPAPAERLQEMPTWRLGTSFTKNWLHLDLVLFPFEFKEDFVKLFRKSLCTLPSVGLPTLLAYRPQSSRENIQIEIAEDYIPKCEYCGNVLKQFPSFDDVCLPSKFCCERYQELYEFILEERRKREAAWSNPISIGPHESHGNETERLLAKERAYQRRQERQMAKQLAFLATEPTSLPECEFAVIYVFIIATVTKGEVLEKYYKHGGKFLTILPDRTATLSGHGYPSGKLAVLVAREAGRFACIVQEDGASGAALRAVFQSTGRSTCYHPNGAVWIHMDTHGGQYLDQAGNRVRTWTWPNAGVSPGPPIPLSPIFISLNRHVGVRIVGQDKITVSFLAMGQQAKFNVGTRGRDVDRPPALAEEQLLLLAFRIRMRQLFDKLRGCLTFPSNEQWDKMKPPAYLSSQALKITQLCKTSDVSEEVHRLVRAIINGQV